MSAPETPDQGGEVMKMLLEQAGHVPTKPTCTFAEKPYTGPRVPGPATPPPLACSFPPGHAGPHRTAFGDRLSGDLIEREIIIRCDRCRTPWPCDVAVAAPRPQPEPVTGGGYRVQQLERALELANTHIQHMAAWISRTNASDEPIHGYSFEALGEDRWIIDGALKARRDLPAGGEEEMREAAAAYTPSTGYTSYAPYINACIEGDVVVITVRGDEDLTGEHALCGAVASVRVPVAWFQELGRSYRTVPAGLPMTGQSVIPVAGDAADALSQGEREGTVGVFLAVRALVAAMTDEDAAAYSEELDRMSDAMDSLNDMIEKEKP